MNFARAARWGLVLLASLATFSVAIVGAGVTWHMLGYFPENRVEVETPGAPSADAGDPAAILALAPFGVAVMPDSATPDVSLEDLSLRGVILAYPSQRSSALISLVGSEVETFKIGETVSGRAVLDVVAHDHVVFIVDGRREKLAFPDVAHATADRSGVAAIRASIPGVTPAAVVSEPSSPTETIDVYRQKIAANPQTVADELGVSASPDGYRVGEIPSAQVRRAGLQPGDLIIRVNGIPVGDLDKDRDNFETVAAAGRARVEVIRDDRLLILSFPLR